MMVMMHAAGADLEIEFGEIFREEGSALIESFVLGGNGDSVCDCKWLLMTLN